MTHTKEGIAKRRATIEAKYGKDYYRRIGKVGGKIGGKISKRGKAKKKG